MRKLWDRETALNLQKLSREDLIEVVDIALEAIERIPVVASNTPMKQMELVRQVKQTAAKQVRDAVIVRSKQGE